MFIVYAFLGALLSLVSTFVGRALFSLGMGYLLFTGFDATLSTLVDSIVTRFSSLPSDVRCTASLLKFGVFLNIVSSAISVRLLMMGLQSDTIKKLTQMSSQ